jgi:hypothetical protein
MASKYELALKLDIRTIQGHIDLHNLKNILFMNSQKLRTGLFAAAITVSTVLAGQAVMAQGIDSTAKKVGHKTASIAVKGVSKIADKTYKGKEGPGGQTVYIDKHDKKYYVDEKGKKIYLKASEIHDKPQ